MTIAQVTNTHPVLLKVRSQALQVTAKAIPICKQESLLFIKNSKKPIGLENPMLFLLEP